MLVENAGIWPQRYRTTRQGHEIGFGVNVLGHFALRRWLGAHGLLTGSRVVVLTGDIYVMQSACPPDSRWRGPLGGMLAYCRSKLGNLWQMRELARRRSEIRVHAVHPGVVGSEFQGGITGFSGLVKRTTMLSPRAGAQTSLFCATQPALATGSYYHNTMGRMDLRSGDPAADPTKAARFWDLLESLSTR